MDFSANNWRECAVAGGTRSALRGNEINELYER
jgi:hypothetical protein